MSKPKDGEGKAIRPGRYITVCSRDMDNRIIEVLEASGDLWEREVFTNRALRIRDDDISFLRIRKSKMSKSLMHKDKEGKLIRPGKYIELSDDGEDDGIVDVVLAGGDLWLSDSEGDYYYRIKKDDVSLLRVKEE